MIGLDLAGHIIGFLLSPAIPNFLLSQLSLSGHIPYLRLALTRTYLPPHRLQQEGRNFIEIIERTSHGQGVRTH